MPQPSSHTELAQGVSAAGATNLTTQRRSVHSRLCSPKGAQQCRLLLHAHRHAWCLGQVLQHQGLRGGHVKRHWSVSVCHGTVAAAPFQPADSVMYVQSARTKVTGQRTASWTRPTRLPVRAPPKVVRGVVAARGLTNGLRLVLLSV